MKDKLTVSFFNQSVDAVVYRYLLGDEFVNNDIKDMYGTWWCNPAMLYLKMYYDHNSKNADRIEWKQIMPVLQYHNGIEKYPEQVIANKTDILCLGMYTWTTQSLDEIIGRIKEGLPDIKIIVGGPDVYVHNDPDWLIDRPWIDYCVYGDGQRPLTNLLDCLLEGKKPDKETSTNIAWVDDEDGLVITPNEIFRDKEFFSRGPWWHCRDHVREWVQYAEDNNFNLQVNFETSRGCPYNCAFCDWNNGLHNKVSKWNLMATYKDLAFLAQEGVRSFRMSDANFGQWEQDLDIAKFIVKCRDKYGRDVLNQCETNWAKMKKDRAFEIMNLWLESGMYTSTVFSYSFQDLNPKTLAAIDRPEIPWEEHKNFILNQHAAFPDIKSQAEYIGGLPYQTVKTMVFATNEGHKIYSDPQWYPWQFLPNAPVRDPEWREKYKVEIYDFDVPFSIVDKELGEKLNLASFKICWSHIEGFEEAVLTFLYKWMHFRLSVPSTKGPETDYMDLFLRMLETKMYDVPFIQTLSLYVKELFEHKHNKAYIETDSFSINLFQLMDSYKWFDADELKAAIPNYRYKNLTDEEYQDRISKLFKEQLTALW